MDNSQRITTASRRLKKICTGLIFCFPLYITIFWVLFNNDPQHGGPDMLRRLPVHVINDLSTLTRFFAFLVDMIPTSVIVYGLVILRELFRLYENGMIFTEKNVSCFRSLGRTLVVWMVCDVIRRLLLSIVLTINNPPGQKEFVLVFDAADFICLFVGFVILAIAWVMDEARKIHEDQASFI